MSEPAPGFVLVLSEVGDPVAGAVYDTLRRRGEPVELVAGEELALARRWVHEVGNDRTHTHIELQDGRMLSDESVRGVFNRLRGTTMPHFANASQPDQDYASSELHALLLSWLASLRCPVANPACARGISGAMRSPVEWAHLASRAGLPVRRQLLASRAGATPHRGLLAHRFPHSQLSTTEFVPWGDRALVGDEPTVFLERVQESRQRVLVVGNDVFGAPFPHWTEPCRRLARDAGVTVLDIEISERLNGANEWVVSQVETHPPALPREGIQAIVRHLCQSFREENP